MAVRLVTGLPGAGKSLFAVSKIIPAALKTGRPVHTNITGIKLDGVKTFGEEAIAKTRKGVDCISVEFLKGLPKNTCLVIDEAHTLFGSGVGEDFSVNGCRAWFAKHRHYGFDIWILVQDSSQLTAQVRNLIEETYHFSRLSVMGLRGVSSLSVYQGLRVAGSRNQNRTATRIVRDDRSAFGQYESAQVEIGSENVSSSGRVRLVFLLLVAVGIAFGIHNIITNAGGQTASEETSNLDLRETSSSTHAAPPAPVSTSYTRLYGSLRASIFPSDR